MNLVEATVDGRQPSSSPASASRSRPGGARSATGKVILGIRPESFEDAAFADPALPQIEVEVSVLEELGSDAHVIFPIDAPRVAAEDLEAAVDEPIEGLIADDQRSLFNARVDPRTEAATGRRSGSPSIRRSSTSSIPRPARRSGLKAPSSSRAASGTAARSRKRLAQGRDGPREAVLARAERILVLDRERPVVADVAERDDELAPELDRVAFTDRAEDPAPLVRAAASSRARR